jgi:hypothetical protein
VGVVVGAEVVDVGTAGFGDAKAEHGEQGEVEPVGRLARRGEYGFELQVGESEHW